MLVRPLPLQLYHPARHPKHPGFPHGHGPRPEAYGQPKGLLVQQGKIYGNTAPTKLLGICVGERTVSTRPTHGSPTSASVKDGCAPGMLSQPRAVASNPHAAVVSFKMCFSLCSLGHLGSSHERHELCPPPYHTYEAYVPNSQQNMAFVMKDGYIVRPLGKMGLIANYTAMPPCAFLNECLRLSNYQLKVSL